MIYGVIAEESISAITPPAGPTAHLSADFINGIYLNGGSATTLSDFTSASGSIDAGGLFVISGTPGLPITGALKTAMQSASWTIVFELNIDASLTGPQNVLFDLYNNVSSNDHEIFCQIWSNWELHDNNNALADVRDAADWTNGLTNGAHKLAITRNDAHIALSVDGFANQVDSSSSFSVDLTSGTPETLFGAFNGGGNATGSFHIKTLNLYAVQSDADLPTLSTP